MSTHLTQASCGNLRALLLRADSLEVLPNFVNQVTLLGCL